MQTHQEFEAPRRRRLVLGYLFAFLFPICTILLREQFVGSRPLTILFVLSILISSDFGGLKAGLVATLISAALMLLVPSPRALSLAHYDDMLQVVFFLSVGTAVSVITSRGRRARELERREHQRKREEASRESMERYRLFLRATSQAVWITNPAGEIESDNEAWCEYTGQTFDEARGFGWVNALHPDDRNQALQVWNKAVQSKEVYEVEYRLRRYDGEWRDVVARGIPVLSIEGNIQEWIGTCIDVTDRNRAEKALKESEQRHRAAAEELKTIMDANPAGICIAHDPDCRVITGNEAAHALFGIPPGENIASALPGKNESPYFKIFRNGIELPGFAQPMQVAAATDAVVRDVELEAVRRDGERRVLMVTAAPLRLAEGVVIGAVGGFTDITSRKRAETELVEAQRKLDSALIAGEVGTFEWDILGERISGDENFSRMFGVAFDEQGRAPLADYVSVIHPDDQERVRRRIALTVETGVDYEIEYRTISGGVTRWLLVRAKPELDASGRVVRASGVCLDVTERKRAEEAVRNSEEKFRAIFEQAAIGIGRVRFSDARWIEVNQAFCRILGYSKEKFQATPWPQMTHPEDVDLDLRSFKKMAAGELESYSVEKRFIHKEGRLVWARLTLSLVRDADGRPDYEIAIIEDISDRINAEKALRESEARFRISQELSPDGFTILRPIYDERGEVSDFIWVYRNATIARLVRIDGIDVIGRRLSEIFPDHIAGPFHPVYREVAKSKQAQVMEAPFHPPGAEKPVWFRVAVVPMDYDIAILAQDITERKRLEDELRSALTSAERARATAEQANKAKDQFLAVLSHELRTPLTPVLAAVSLLKRTEHLSPNALENLEVITRNVSLEARLIDDLLDLTRIARGKIVLDKQSLYICDILSRAAEVCRPDIEAKNIHFGMTLKDTPIPVHGDTSRLQQVFWNLINNAVKFTPDGGCIGVSGHRENEHIVVDVADSGIGIEPHALTRIFDAFEQTDQKITRQFGGLGLGLAIAKRLVELHGGQISACSSGQGAGATFRVVLPVHKEMIQGESVKEGSKVEAPKVSKRILLVEDHGDTALMMKKMLQSSGYDVETAADVRQALDALEHSSFEILISDLGLPDRSGLELIKELRDRGSAIAAIALSGYGREEDIAKSKSAGFTEHLTKPVDLEFLTKAVERVERNGPGHGSACL